MVIRDKYKSVRTEELKHRIKILHMVLKALVVKGEWEGCKGYSAMYSMGVEWKLFIQ